MVENQPDNSSRAKLNIEGIRVSSLQSYATRQLHQIESIGARFAEIITTPIMIENPLPLPTSHAILVTRWIGGGVFGVVFTDTSGESMTGWISIAHAIKANPGLTPSGTFSGERWDKNIFTKRDHLLPRSATLREHAQRTGAKMAGELLSRFPNRVDLSPSFDLEMLDQGVILEIAAERLRPLSKELHEGLTRSPLCKREDAPLHRLIGEIANSLVKKIVIEHALQTFTVERMRQAREDYEHSHAESVIQRLIDDSSKVTATVMTPLVRATLFKDPFATAPASELRQRCGTGISISMTQHREYSELWKHLKESERSKIVSEISTRAWSDAVIAYTTCN